MNSKSLKWLISITKLCSFGKLLSIIHRLLCSAWNGQYYQYPGIDRSVIFAASFPGMVRILLPEKCIIAENTVINAGAVIHSAGGVNIGKHVHIGHGLCIYSINHNYQSTKSIPYDDIDLLGPVNVGDFVWCGANVTILPGVTVGEGAVIGGGSVVTKNVPKYAVVGGNPARVLKYRDAELFERLKCMGMYG